MSGCTPLFLKAEPQSTGVMLMSRVAWRITSRRCAGVISAALEIRLEQVVVVVGDGFDELEAVFVGQRTQVVGDVDDLEVGPELVLVERGPSSR